MITIQYEKHDILFEPTCRNRISSNLNGASSLLHYQSTSHGKWREHDHPQGHTSGPSHPFEDHSVRRPRPLGGLVDHDRKDNSVKDHSVQDNSVLHVLRNCTPRWWLSFVEITCAIIRSTHRYCCQSWKWWWFIANMDKKCWDRLSRSRDDSAAVHAKGDLRQLSVSRYYATCNCNNLVHKLIVATTYTLNAMEKKKVGGRQKKSGITASFRHYLLHYLLNNEF